MASSAGGIWGESLLSPQGPIVLSFLQEHNVQTYFIKREEPMRPRRRERKRGPQGQGGSSSCLLNLRNPSLILNAGLLASALTNLTESGAAKNGKDKKRFSTQTQNGGQGHYFSNDSRSHSQTELSIGDENHQNVSNTWWYVVCFIVVNSWEGKKGK